MTQEEYLAMLQKQLDDQLKGPPIDWHEVADELRRRNEGLQNYSANLDVEISHLEIELSNTLAHEKT